MNVPRRRYGPELIGLRKLSPKVTGGILRAKEAAYADGVFPSKVKVLTSLAISVAIRCEPCIRTYVERALELGATEQEVVEFLNIAIAMQGCPGEAWALKAYKIYHELRDSPETSIADSRDIEACCQD